MLYNCAYRSMLNVVVVLLTLGQSLMVQVAKRGASVLKRRKSRNRMEAPSNDGQPSGIGGGQQPPPRSESDGDVVFYVEEPRAGKFISSLTNPYLENN